MDYQKKYCRLDETNFSRMERIKPFIIQNSVILIGTTIIKNFLVIKF